MVSLSRSQMLTLAASNYAFFVVILSLHVLQLLTISPPWDRYVGLWLIANTVAFGANAMLVKSPNPHIVPPTCPYCKSILTVGTYHCPSHGNLTPEKEA